jgi:hypothetical protein
MRVLSVSAMRSLLAVLVLLVAMSRASAQPAPDLPVDAATRTKVIEGALAALTRYYVFPDVAAKINISIRRGVAAKKYDGVTSGRAFAELLTNDLRVVNHDMHIGVEFSVEPVPDRKAELALTPAEREQLHRRFTFSNAGFVKAERLAGNVGYLRLDAFAPPEEAAPRMAAAMSLLTDTGALIIDMRSNGGGWPATVGLLISYLFPADEELHLHDLYSRFDGVTHQYWTSIEVSGKRYLGKPVYVLTSTHTFSAAEGLAYDLQALKRATIVGEVTGGGAHPSLVEKLDTHFLLIVPNARVINPVTHTDWEGTGVKPDVAVPADRALDVSYLAALDVAKPAIDPRLEPDAVKEIDEAIATLRPAKK